MNRCLTSNTIDSGKGLIEAFKGEDLLTGESLSWLERFLGLILLAEIWGMKKGIDLLQAAVDAAEATGKKGKIWSKGKSGDPVKNAFEHFQYHGSDFDDVNNSV